jgi:hypothetical protein
MFILEEEYVACGRNNSNELGKYHSHAMSARLAAGSVN